MMLNFFNFFNRDKTYSILKKRLYEEMKRADEMEKLARKNEKKLQKLQQDLNLSKTKNSMTEKRNTFTEHERLLSYWLRNMVDDFSNGPYESKFDKGFGVTTDLGNINWTYRFGDGIRSIQIFGNLKMPASLTITLHDKDSSSPIAITFELLRELLKLFEVMTTKIQPEPNSSKEPNTSNISKMTDNELSALMDKALDDRDLEKVKALNEELDKRKHKT